VAYPDPKIVAVAAPTNPVNTTRPPACRSARSTTPTSPYVVILNGGQHSCWTASNRGWRPFAWPGCSASSSGATVFRRSAGGRRLRLLAGSNEAMFVCVDDGLDPVAESKFHEDAGDMRLDRRIADDEGCGDRDV
jgi:hypothetical protein